MRKYKHLFFDLDRTLWDFDKNTGTTLIELFEHFNLGNLIEDVNKFISRYHYYNDAVWDLYRIRKMPKQKLRSERFRLLLEEYNLIDEKLVAELDSYFISHAPLKSGLIENTIELLNHVSPNYNLYIVSNGFKEIQLRKMKSAGIEQYFKKVFTSDVIGYSKPHYQFFGSVLSSSNARKRESLFIGDDFTNDVEGPALFGIDQVWFNPERNEPRFKPTFEIGNLLELIEILP